MIKDTQSGRVINMVAVMLIILAAALAYMGNVIDFSLITEPFDTSEVTADGENVGAISEVTEQIPGLNSIRTHYLSFQNTMQGLENSIAEFDNYFVIVAALLAVFAIKSLVSIVPLSATCLISGLVFSLPVALLINFAGVSLILAIKYFWGTRIGEGNISKLMKHSQFLWKYIEDAKSGDGKGNPLVLFILRIVPTVPINPISQMYGNMGFDFWRFMRISLAGYSVKIVSFTALGSNASNPFSAQFIVPLVIILFFSGVGMLAFSLMLRRKANKNR